jgi:hypothetical protein
MGEQVLRPVGKVAVKNPPALIVLRQNSRGQHPLERGAHGKAFVAAMVKSRAVSGIDSGDTDTATQLRFDVAELPPRVRVCRLAYLRSGEGQRARPSQDEFPTRPIQRSHGVIAPSFNSWIFGG